MVSKQDQNKVKMELIWKFETKAQLRGKKQTDQSAQEIQGIYKVEKVLFGVWGK